LQGVTPKCDPLGVSGLIIQKGIFGNNCSVGIYPIISHYWGWYYWFRG